MFWDGRKDGHTAPKTGDQVDFISTIALSKDLQNPLEMPRDSEASLRFAEESLKNKTILSPF